VPDNDDLTNIRNVLGFLLAGFGALLSFLGIRSSEISTVLRNDSQRASIIAFILLLGVLAAVSAIVTKSRKRVNTVSAVAIGLVLFGVGALVIFYIPVGSDSESISKWIGAGLVAAGAIALLISLISGRFWANLHQCHADGNRSIRGHAAREQESVVLLVAGRSQDLRRRAHCHGFD